MLDDPLEFFATFNRLDEEQIEALCRVLDRDDVGVPRSLLDPLVAEGILKTRQDVIEGSKTDSGLDVTVTRYAFLTGMVAMDFRHWFDERCRRMVRPCIGFEGGDVRKDEPTAAAKAKVAMHEAYARSRAIQDRAPEKAAAWVEAGRLRDAWIEAVMLEERPPLRPVTLSLARSCREVYAESYAIRSDTTMIHRETLRSLVEGCIASLGGAPAPWDKEAGQD